MLSEQQKRDLAQRMQTLRAELEHSLQAGQSGSAPVELDQTRVGRLSRMDAMQAQAMAKAAQSRVARDLASVKSAQRRLNDADFGACEECDEPIAWARLKLKPGVRLCINCAQALEG